MQIESFKGKLKFWKNQVAYSTVTLNLEKVDAVTIITHLFIG